jgi:signal transduction histidine kinase
MSISVERRAAFFLPLRRIIGDFKLDSKLVAMLILIGMIGFFGIFAGLSSIITPSFAKLEQMEVNKQIDRTKAVLDEFSMRVQTTVKDYGAWTESYDYLRAPSRAFEADTFSVLAMSNLDVNGMAYIKFDGTILFSRWVDIEKQLEVPTLDRDFDEITGRAGFVQMMTQTRSMRSYARVGGQVAAISAAQVVRTDGNGTPSGFVVMARALNSAQLSELLQLDARIALSDRKAAPLISSTANKLNVAVNIAGLNGSRVAQAKFDLDRKMTVLGQRTLLLAALCSAIGLLLVLLALRALMKRLVIAPMRAVEQHMLSVSSSGALAALEGFERKDEIGSLVRNLNFMLRQLKDLREQLEVQSFKLGRTESAVGVMHNVRNGLNPISVILSRMVQDSSIVSTGDAARAIVELERSDLDEDRRKKLTQFLKLALTAQIKHSGTRIEELETARECLNRVVDLIGKQQADAHQHIDTEACEIADVVRQNAALAQYSSNRRIRFEIAEGSYKGQAHRLLLSQVVGNLFSNASEAIASASREIGLIEVTFSEAHEQACIHVRDNGEGFEAAQVKQFFERGFSNREHKSGGLGLHWCANALSLMGGRLELSSDGPGLGAVATIKLPKSDPTLSGSLAHPGDRLEPDSNPGSAVEALVREKRNHR